MKSEQHLLLCEFLNCETQHEVTYSDCVEVMFLCLSRSCFNVISWLQVQLLHPQFAAVTWGYFVMKMVETDCRPLKTSMSRILKKKKKINLSAQWNPTFNSSIYNFKWRNQNILALTCGRLLRWLTPPMEMVSKDVWRKHIQCLMSLNCKYIY